MHHPSYLVLVGREGQYIVLFVDSDLDVVVDGLHCAHELGFLRREDALARLGVKGILNEVLGKGRPGVRGHEGRQDVGQPYLFFVKWRQVAIEAWFCRAHLLSRRSVVGGLPGLWGLSKRDVESFLTELLDRS